MYFVSVGQIEADLKISSRHCQYSVAEMGSVLVGDRKRSISAFGRNFRFRLMPKHFGKISLSAERTFSAEMTHFCRNWGINGAGSNRNRGNFGRNNPLSAEIPSFGFFLLFRISYGWFLLSAEIAHSQTPSFGFGRNSFGRPLWRGKGWQ